MKEHIGEHIAIYRKKAGLTQEQLAEKMNVTAQAVSKWENGLTCPDLDSVARLAGFLGVTVEQLIHGDAAVLPFRWWRHPGWGSGCFASACRPRVPCRPTSSCAFPWS